MCARFTLKAKLKELAEEFGLIEPHDVEPRYKIAPTQRVPVVRLLDWPARRCLDMLRWGLVPKWAKDLSVGSRMINARTETVAMKPAFRDAFRKRRCLVPATGFCEWKQMDPGSGSKPKKQPYLIHRRDDRVFALAGLWEEWQDTEGLPIETFTILTTEPNDFMRPFHDRMPLIIGRNDYGLWLDPEVQGVDRLQPLLRACASGDLTAYPVNTYVNSPNNDDPMCIQPLA